MAIQEVSPDLKALGRLNSLIDTNWDYLETNSTEGAGFPIYDKPHVGKNPFGV
jgi:hypothetical protein